MSRPGRESTGGPDCFAISTAQMSRPSLVLPIETSLARSGWAATADLSAAVTSSYV